MFLRGGIQFVFSSSRGGIKTNKVLVVLGSCDYVQTEKSIFEYAKLLTWNIAPFVSFFSSKFSGIPHQ